MRPRKAEDGALHLPVVAREDVAAEHRLKVGGDPAQSAAQMMGLASTISWPGTVGRLLQVTRVLSGTLTLNVSPGSSPSGITTSPSGITSFLVQGQAV